MTTSDVISKLKSEINCNISTEKSDLETYGTDWTREFNPDPLAVIFPKTIEDVKNIVSFANKNKVSLTPSGGRTGLSAGAVAKNGELVVSFEKMNKVLSFNKADRTLEVQAGITTKEIQDYAKEKGLFYPVDFSSAGSSQIGGNIATNAGGIRVIRYGLTRQWIKGLKVVTGKGDILELNKGLTKNATGYDLMNLFIGSEGTLGLIAEATIQLTTQPKDSSVILIGLKNIENSIKVLELFREKLTLNAFEFFSHSAVKHVVKKLERNIPVCDTLPYYLLVDIETPSDNEIEIASEIYTNAFETGLIEDGVISQNPSQYRELWSFRENITEAISVFLTYKNDISVRTSQIPDFINDISAILNNEYPDFDTILFGHIGDGNIHVSILKPHDFDKEKFLNLCRGVNTKIFETVAKYDGSISAEHGVGLIKKPYLTYTRSEAEIELMKGIKKVFDPNGIMNPGKIF